MGTGDVRLPPDVEISHRKGQIAIHAMGSGDLVLTALDAAIDTQFASLNAVYVNCPVRGNTRLTPLRFSSPQFSGGCLPDSCVELTVFRRCYLVSTAS